MIPRIVHQIWLGGTIPSAFEKNRQDLMAMNPDWRCILWDERAICDSMDVDLVSLAGHFPARAGVSNAVRLYALFNYGGMYFDLDFVPMKPLDLLLEYGNAAAQQKDGRVCNAFMQAERDADYIRWMIDRMYDHRGIAPYWGVELLTMACNANPVAMLPAQLVYPYNFDDPPDMRHAHPDTVMCHTWAGSWLPK